MTKRRHSFGTGKVKYHAETEFPDLLEHDGCLLVRTDKYAFVSTGMTTFRYETEGRAEDLRLYVDAAGHIWDEKTDGIL